MLCYSSRTVIHMLFTASSLNHFFVCLTQSCVVLFIMDPKYTKSTVSERPYWAIDLQMKWSNMWIQTTVLWHLEGKGAGGRWRWAQGGMGTEREFVWGDRCMMQCADDVLLSCKLETCIVLWTNITPINSI